MNLQETFTEYQLLKQAYDNTYKKLHALSNLTCCHPFSKKKDNDDHYNSRLEQRHETEKHLFELSSKMDEINKQLREYMYKKHNIYLENL